MELDAAGRLQGLVVDVQGLPVTGAEVMVRQADRPLLKCYTDQQGRFSTGPIRGGTYHLLVGARGSVVRVWRPNTAPPAAKEMALIVADTNVVRGQMPLEDFLSSDVVVGAALIGAIVALPIILHNSGSKTPASP